jgi:hypothetical protein
MHVGTRRDLEDALDPCFVGAAPDQVHARSSPAEQAQRLDQDALARARLTGDGSEPRPERQLRFVDQREP